MSESSSQYFVAVVAGITVDDAKLLGALFQEDASSAIKAMTGSSLRTMCELSEANYRRALYRMEATQLIRRVPGVEPYRVFITGWGVQALQQTLRGGN